MPGQFHLAQLQSGQLCHPVPALLGRTRGHPTGPGPGPGSPKPKRPLQPAVAVVGSFGSTVGLHLLFQTRCLLLFLLLLTPPKPYRWAGQKSHLLVCFGLVFFPCSGATSGITLAFLLCPQFSSSVSCSQDESKCLGIPKECVVGRAKQTAPPLLRDMAQAWWLIAALPSPPILALGSPARAR